MKTTPSRKTTKAERWPREVQPGRAVVRVYRRKTPSGNFGYLVANYADGDTRRFDSYKSEPAALEAADALAKRLDRRDYVAASMTRAQAIEFANSEARLKPFGVSVDAATATIAECLKVVGDLANIHAAVKFCRTRHKQIVKKSVAELVADFLALKKSRGASGRYVNDLKARLTRFADDCKKEAGNVSTPDVQAWLDGLRLAPQNYKNFRTVLHTLFKFAVTRSHAAHNPVADAERVKVNGGEIQIFTPVEIGRLLAVVSPEFLPCLALGAFAGLRSAENERLEWSDIHLAERFIVVGASKAKTAGRRIVPICDNLASWLADYSKHSGKVWKGTHDEFYEAQQATAAATAVESDSKKNIPAQEPVKWKANGLRHSYASYRFAICSDAGRVAGELGNSAQIVHRHYKELCKSVDAQRWFNVKPERPSNVLTLPAAVNG